MGTTEIMPSEELLDRVRAAGLRVRDQLIVATAGEPFPISAAKAVVLLTTYFGFDFTHEGDE